ncbi:hypothetical protein, partial [Mesorhizobium sp. M00.F.Ca.ET.217.01.1.1]
VKITDDELIVLASAVGLPAPERAIRALLKCKTPVRAMVELLWVISKLAPIHEEQQLVRCIARGRQPAAILASLFSLTEFPEPPFEQAGALIPIT